MLIEPPWLTRARRFIGVAEIKGPQHHTAILDLLDIADGVKDGKPLQGIRDDETPWCATFVSAVLELESIPSTRSAWARSYLTWGDELDKAAVGAIAVLERGPTSGHVAFVVGRTDLDQIMLLGGNQSDSVRISAFDTRRVLGYRWPKFTDPPANPGFIQLPTYVGGVPSSSEA